MPPLTFYLPRLARMRARAATIDTASPIKSALRFMARFSFLLFLFIYKVQSTANRAARDRDDHQRQPKAGVGIVAGLGRIAQFIVHGHGNDCTPEIQE